MNVSDTANATSISAREKTNVLDPEEQLSKQFHSVDDISFKGLLVCLELTRLRARDHTLFY